VPVGVKLLGMKTIRKTWPQVREYRKGKYTYYLVDLRRAGFVGPKFKNFPAKSLAMAYAAEISERLENNGKQAFTQPKDDPRWNTAEEELRVYGKTVEEAIKVAISVFQAEAVVKNSPFVSDLLTRFYDDKAHNKLDPLRPSTLRSIKEATGRFKQDFGTMRVKEITKDFIREYLSKMDVSQQRRKNLLALLKQFFNHTKERDYCDVANPTEGIEIKVITERPEFFTAEQCAVIMKRAKANDIQNYVALMLFTGIRPAEAAKLVWKQHVNMESNQIDIPANISKTKRERLIPINDTLRAWLVAENKPLIHPNHEKLRRKMVSELGFAWIQDGLRHSYATYHYARFKDVNEMAATMGNCGYIAQKHYQRAIPQSEADAFWKIRPE